MVELEFEPVRGTPTSMLLTTLITVEFKHNCTLETACHIEARRNAQYNDLHSI